MIIIPPALRACVCPSVRLSVPFSASFPFARCDMQALPFQTHSIGAMVTTQRMMTSKRAAASRTVTLGLQVGDYCRFVLYEI